MWVRCCYLFLGIFSRSREDTRGAYDFLARVIVLHFTAQLRTEYLVSWYLEINESENCIQFSESQMDVELSVMLALAGC